MSEDNKQPVAEPKEKESQSEDLDGLKRNRDEILAEKKNLEKRLKKFEQEAAEREQKELEEKGKFKELYEKTHSELLTMKQRLEFEKVAKKFSFDTDYSDVVMNRVQFDKDGKVVEAETFFETLKNERPKLFNDDKKEVLPVDTSKPKSDAAKFNHIFTRKEIDAMTQDEYRKHKDLILKQSAQGLIV